MLQGIKYSLKQKPLHQEDLDIPNISPEQFQALSKMFSQPSCSNSEEYVKIVTLLGQNPQMPLHAEYDMFLVNDDMTIEELIKKWYQYQFNNQQNKKQPKDYVIVYHTQPQPISFDASETILDLKYKIGVQKIPHDLHLAIYEHSYYPVHSEQCTMQESDFVEFQKKYQNNLIDIPIKVHLTHQRAYYFNIEKVSFYIAIKELDKKIRDQLRGKKHPVRCEEPIKYTLSVEKETNVENFVKNLKTYKVQLNKIWQNNKLIFDPLIGHVGVRKLCFPGQIVHLKFTNSSGINLVLPPGADDCEIRIEYYETVGKKANQTIKNPEINKIEEIYKFKSSYIKYKNIQNEAKNPEINKMDEMFKTKSSFMDKNMKNDALLIRKNIVKNYSDICKMKISTLLKESKIDEPLTTCLCLNGRIIRPTQKFEEIEQIKLNMKLKKPTIFTCVSDNFVFYQEIAELSKKNSNRTIDDLLNTFQSNKSFIIGQDQRKSYTSSREAKKNQLKATPNVKEQHKKVHFFDPIMLYTSNLIYWQLNHTLRTTSVPLFSKDKISNQCWHYQTSQKIITNLMQLENYRGTVYRGSRDFEYNYQPGSIIQWCCFTSTSISKQRAQGFSLGGKIPYVFEIKTFSGKPIENFSKYKTQSEILILPYTKFKVIEVQVDNKKVDSKNYRACTYVKLLELPIPKRIPGHVVVWIDNNIKQSYDDFEKIRSSLNLKDFDLIQLQSNDHLISWLHAYKYLLDMPQMKLHFITNMNRTLEKKKEGIDTLEIIRSFDATSAVVFFIFNVEQKKKDLKERGWDKDENVFVIQALQQLESIFKNKFLEHK